MKLLLSPRRQQALIWARNRRNAQEQIDALRRYEEAKRRVEFPRWALEGRRWAEEAEEKDRGGNEDRCETCGSRISFYRMGCPLCGAPQCCQRCCKEGGSGSEEASP